MNYYIVNQDWLDHLIKCGGFLGHDAAKVQLSGAPDDGQKRVALTREDITAFQVSILHGDEAHQRWLIMEFERWVDKLFGEEQVG